jgi:hypothetical protein
MTWWKYGAHWSTLSIPPKHLTTKPIQLHHALRSPARGLSQIMRVRYTAGCKLGLLALAKRIMEEEGVTL